MLPTTSLCNFMMNLISVSVSSKYQNLCILYFSFLNNWDSARRSARPSASNETKIRVFSGFCIFQVSEYLLLDLLYPALLDHFRFICSTWSQPLTTYGAITNKAASIQYVIDVAVLVELIISSECFDRRLARTRLVLGYNPWGLFHRGSKYLLVKLFQVLGGGFGINHLINQLKKF